jgi:hypothetical protein
MAVGFPTKADYATGDVLTAANMNDLAGTLNTVNTPLGNAAGKNKIINGDFGVWQRGTSFTVSTGVQTYTSDRFAFNRDGSGTVIVSRQAFTPGTAPVAGYEGSYYLRFNQSVAGSGGTYSGLVTRLEDVQTFAGQTMTLSFWAKADAARSVTASIQQNFGSGGSGAVSVTSSAINLTTSWARYTYTVTLANLTGKTIGTSSYLQLFMNLPLNVAQTIEFWGLQMEAGSTATPFQTATGTIGGELALCQRYYWRTTANATYTFAQLNAGVGVGNNANTASLALVHPVTMRSSTSTTIDYGGTIAMFNGVAAVTGITLAMDSSSTQTTRLAVTKTGSFASYIPYTFTAWGDAAAYIGLSAEL